MAPADRGGDGVSPWWLLITVPVCVLAGFAVAAMFGGRSYDRGWKDGYQRGWNARKPYWIPHITSSGSAREAVESITRRKM